MFSFTYVHLYRLSTPEKEEFCPRKRMLGCGPGADGPSSSESCFCPPAEQGRAALGRRLWKRSTVEEGGKRVRYVHVYMRI
jgi:hypothetical protein